MRAKVRVQYLTVIKCACDGDIVYVCVGDGSHLCFLDRRDAPFGMEYKNRDVRLIPEPVDCGADHDVGGGNWRANILKTHLPVSPLVAPITVNFSFFWFGVLLAFLRSKKNSNRFPKNCKAMSLKAKVGPWNNSSMKVLSSNFFRGTISG